MTKQTSKTFDQLSKAYEENNDLKNPYNSLYERPAMMGLLPVDLSDNAILDAGCAAGWYMEELTFRGAAVTGIDLSEKMVNAAKRRLKGKADIYQHDLTKTLPFEDYSFDYVISSLTMHYLEDWHAPFSEIKRVLKLGGELIFSVHHPFMDFTRFSAGNYFEKKLLTDTWYKEGETITISFYRRSLQEIMNDTARFFTVEEIIEPRPVPEMKKIDPAGFEYLQANPHFLLIRAVKE